MFINQYLILKRDYNLKIYLKHLLKNLTNSNISPHGIWVEYNGEIIPKIIYLIIHNTDKDIK